MYNAGLTTIKARVTTGTNPDGIHLQIEDETSGTLLAELDLSGERIWDLLRGTSFNTQAVISTDLDRVGLTMESEIVVAPKDKISHVSYDQALEAAVHWAKFNYPEWTTYDARRQSGGQVSVIMRRWV